MNEGAVRGREKAASKNIGPQPRECEHTVNPRQSDFKNLISCCCEGSVICLNPLRSLAWHGAISR